MENIIREIIRREIGIRLPHRVIVKIDNNIDKDVHGIKGMDLFVGDVGDFHPKKLEKYSFENHDIKLYLIQMSKMTKEDKDEHFYYSTLDKDVFVNWLHSRAFDYNNLIEKGFAVEAKENMYK